MIKSTPKKEVWRGWIIDKSLKDQSVLFNSSIKIIKSHREENNSGPEKQVWKLYVVEMEEKEIKNVRMILEKQIKEEWYTHFTNGKKLLIIFHKKSFIINVEKTGNDKGNGITSFEVNAENKKVWDSAFIYGMRDAKVHPNYMIKVK